jgi:hypothetical protein
VSETDAVGRGRKQASYAQIALFEAPSVQPLMQPPRNSEMSSTPDPGAVAAKGSSELVQYGPYLVHTTCLSIDAVVVASDHLAEKGRPWRQVLNPKFGPNAKLANSMGLLFEKRLWVK